MSSSRPDSTSSSTEAGAVHDAVRSYAELQQRIHDDLRAQHPEWVEPDGNCPTCESYERRLAETIGLFQSAERNLIAA